MRNTYLLNYNKAYFTNLKIALNFDGYAKLAPGKIVVIMKCEKYNLKYNYKMRILFCMALTFITFTSEFNPKRAGLFGPISQPGGFRPPKISETDWRNIKCVVLVDSYDPPESIGTKKSTNIPCMTPQWRHKWRHVKNTKITKNRQNHGFSLFFQAKVAFFGNDVCQSMLTHVLTPNKPNK